MPRLQRSGLPRLQRNGVPRLQRGRAAVRGHGLQLPRPPLLPLGRAAAQGIGLKLPRMRVKAPVPSPKKAERQSRDQTRARTSSV